VLLRCLNKTYTFWCEGELTTAFCYLESSLCICIGFKHENSTALNQKTCEDTRDNFKE